METQQLESEMNYTGEVQYNSALLKSKAVRQKIEDNVNALRNRISFLENEECKLLSKIEETKIRALEVIKIKKDARIHSQNLFNHTTEKELELAHRKEEVHEMRDELKNNLTTAYSNTLQNHVSKAEEVKATLSSLKEYYKEVKKAEQRENIEKCNNQRTFEAELEEKKARIRRETAQAAKQRYESAIRTEEEKSKQYENVIKILEAKETDMLKRLQKTQTQHQLYMEDFDKITANQEPTGPLSTLRDSMAIVRTKPKFVASPKPRVSPGKPSPVKPTLVESTANHNSNGSKQYGRHHLYQVNDYYR